jgi:hypothetical protein
MALGQEVYGRLVGDTGVTDLVGGRVYPLLLPQVATMPAISYQRISNTQQLGSTPLRRSRYQIDCWGATYSAADTVAEAVKACMEEASFGGVKMAEVAGQQDDHDIDSGMYRVMVDILFLTIGD